jgi:hypothetical protein
MSPHRIRLPISTRHAFALAFDLAARRDPLHSLIVPLLLRTPWNVALWMLPPINQSDRPIAVTLLTLAALLGDFVVMLVVQAMLRFRARSVFNTPLEVHPAPVTECYALGIRRVPWLLVTELARNIAIVVSSFFLFLPALLVGFRLAFATESVVLHEPNTSRAFQRSFKLTQGRFERWLEMIVVSVVLIFAIILLMAFLMVIVPGPATNTWVSSTLLLVTAITPIIQYAWTFFYLRLVEIEAPAGPGIEVGPLYAAVTPPVAVAALPVDAAPSAAAAEPAPAAAAIAPDAGPLPEDAGPATPDGNAGPERPPASPDVLAPPDGSTTERSAG